MGEQKFGAFYLGFFKISPTIIMAIILNLF